MPRATFTQGQRALGVLCGRRLRSWGRGAGGPYAADLDGLFWSWRSGSHLSMQKSQWRPRHSRSGSVCTGWRRWPGPPRSRRQRPGLSTKRCRWRSQYLKDTRECLNGQHGQGQKAILGHKMKSYWIFGVTPQRKWHRQLATGVLIFTQYSCSKISWVNQRNTSQIP